MMASAQAVHALAGRLRAAGAQEEKRAEEDEVEEEVEEGGHGGEVMPLKVSVQGVEDLRQKWIRQPCVQLNPFDPAELRSLRDELVADLRGLQPIETSHTQALVLPLDAASGASPVLLRLLETLRAQAFRRLVESITGLGPLTSPCCALVAIPPGGQVLPQCFAGEQDCGEVAFALFLTEDWWNQEDGGQFEVYGPEKGKPIRTLSPEPCLLLYAAGAGAAITRVLTEDAPQLAVHGILAGRGAEEQRDPWQDAPFRSLFEGRGNEQEALNTWVSERFLDMSMKGELRTQFEEASHVKLPGFLTAALAERVAAAIDTVGSGCKGWQEEGPVRVQRYLALSETRTRGASSCPVGRALADVAGYMASDGFLQYLEAITGVKRTGSASLQIRRFRPGLDFQRPTSTARSQLDVLLGFEVASASADDGRVRRRRARKQLLAMGGADGYVEGEAHLRTAEAAGILAGPAGIPAPVPVLLRLPLRNNVLRLVLRDPATSHYVEPLQVAAPTSRWEIRLTVPVEELPDSDEETESQEAPAPKSKRPRREVPEATPRRRAKRRVSKHGRPGAAGLRGV